MNKKTPQGVEILSIEAKDLYLSNNLIIKNDHGCNVRYSSGEKKDELILKKFINTFDYSLDMIYWNEIRNEYICAKNEPMYYYGSVGKHSVINHKYTLDIINVTFKYSVKLYNKKTHDFYIKNGYTCNEDELIDNVLIKNNEIIGIKVNNNVKNPISDEILGKYFFYDKAKKQYRARNSIPTVLSSYELRKWIYNNGFICDGKKYIRWKRSSGSARVGKCLFIDERLYDVMHKWEMCGIDIKENDKVDLASLEAYISLTLSSIIDTIDIKPKNILVIDDYESIFSEVCVDTTNINGQLVTDEKKIEIKNSIWDGQSLMDISLFGEYSKYGMLLLRNKFFKSCCFNANIQKWFDDNNITEINQLNGYTIATKIEDIKLITTPSSIKYAKFGTIEDWISKIDSTFGVVKHEKKTHHLNGNMVSTHYQLLNTLQMSEEEVKEFLQDPLDYLNLFCNDFAILRNHIGYSLYNEDFNEPFLTNNDIMYRLLGLNDDVSKTKIFDKLKSDVYDSYVKEMRSGRILCKGNYSTLLGNPIEMLRQSIGMFDGCSYMTPNTIHSKRFKDNEEILGSRSPHVCTSCILIAKNKYYDKINKYVNLTNEIVCVNSINENLLQKLSGADFDSDTVLLTNNSFLIKAAKKNYENFKVSTNSVRANKVSRKYNNIDKSDLDYKTSVNLIGQIINLSQQLNSIMWDKLNNGTTFEEIKQIHYDICQLNVMSGIEIDSAKKEFDVDNLKELTQLRLKYKRKENGKNIKPYFFYYILKYKDLLNTNVDMFLHHDTTMDFIEEHIEKMIRKKKYRKNHPKKFVRFFDVLDQGKYKYDKANRRQYAKVIQLLEDFNSYSLYLFSLQGITKEELYSNYNRKKVDTIEKINNYKLNFHTIVYILKMLDNKKYDKLYKRCFNLLFCQKDSIYIKAIKLGKNDIKMIKQNKDGDIDLLGVKYKKYLKSRKKEINSMKITHFFDF